MITDPNPVLGGNSCFANSINDAGRIVAGCSDTGGIVKLAPTAPGVDVGVSMKAAPNPVMVGQSINYTWPI